MNPYDVDIWEELPSFAGLRYREGEKMRDQVFMIVDTVLIARNRILDDFKEFLSGGPLLDDIKKEIVKKGYRVDGIFKTLEEFSLCFYGDKDSLTIYFEELDHFYTTKELEELKSKIDIPENERIV